MRTTIISITARQFLFGSAALMVAVVLLMLPRDYAVCRAQPLDEKAERSWPMFGGSPSRNMVNANERDLPVDWCIKEGKRKNIKWVAALGDRTIGSPIVARGKIFVTTNNARPRDPKVQGDKAVLMAFRERDGQFLWQIAHDIPAHWHGSSGALASTPTVVDRHLYYVTSAGEVVCADADHGKIQWRYDMAKQLKVHMYQDWCFARVAPSWSSPLLVGNYLFVATGNGIDVEDRLVSPKAASFIALDKRTGKLAWQSNLPSENTIAGQWSSATFADHRGRPQVIFAGGDGVIYSFVPETGALLWKCDCLPARKKKSERGFHCQFIGTPVVVGHKLYVGLGVAPDGRGKTRWSYFLCLDITKKGDVSLRNYDAKSVDNQASALVWAFGGPIEPRPEMWPRVYFGPTISTAAVHEGLVYITEEYGYLHCLDAATGSRVWVYDLEASLPGSPCLVKDRVYIGTEDGEVWIFAHRRAAKVLAKIDMDQQITTTPVAANGTLYVMTRSKLFAIGSR
ncbi:MAG TPA: PQQ-binding-like beta-propeller repeat protein [Gemmataceae bacterium]|nr:PQQ-binding-like beta-propeller repeat protein [Gemmataceae bacterium]